MRRREDWITVAPHSPNDPKNVNWWRTRAMCPAHVLTIEDGIDFESPLRTICTDWDRGAAEKLVVSLLSGVPLLQPMYVLNCWAFQSSRKVNPNRVGYVALRGFEQLQSIIEFTQGDWPVPSPTLVYYYSHAEFHEAHIGGMTYLEIVGRYPHVAAQLDRTVPCVYDVLSPSPHIIRAFLKNLDEIAGCWGDVKYVDWEYLSPATKKRLSVATEPCSVADQFCEAPAGAYIGTGATCFKCGQNVCKNCSMRVEYAYFGRKRLCHTCIAEEDDNEDRVIRHLERLAQ